MQKWPAITTNVDSSAEKDFHDLSLGAWFHDNIGGGGSDFCNILFTVAL